MAELGSFTGDCPYCGFKSVFLSKDRFETEIPSGSYKVYVDIFGRCVNCKRGVIQTFQRPFQSQNDAEILPSPPSNKPPEHTPPVVGKYYTQGKNSMNGDWDAAGAMFRSTLEAALDEIIPDTKGDLLRVRIDEAAGRRLLTPQMAGWAHQIRILGNSAVHSDSFSEDDAREIQIFTEMMLTYLFRLPGMMKKARDKSSNNKKGSNIVM